MGAPAYLAHQVDGRCRLRLPSEKGNAAYFRRLRELLLPAPGILDVEVRPRSGSVIVYHELSLTALQRLAEERELFELHEVQAKPEKELANLADELFAIDARLRQRSGGRWGLSSVAFTTLVGAGVVQTLRGNVLPAATTLFAQAFGVLMRTVEVQHAAAALAEQEKEEVPVGRRAP